MAGWRELVAVAVGGGIGTGIRLGLDTVLPHTDTTFPVSTLLINIVGSFLLGLLVSTLWTRPTIPSWLKAGLGVGTIGSFTTFSALIVSLLTEADNGLWMLAILYLVLTLVLGFGAAALGIRLGGRRVQRPDLVDE
ncbi:MAG TPA: CrcB family protein [Lacisediminihabitans sp.]|uniref:fluoride efflux transporter FluC n=1 Tax=Lacisediminihabitans sp. TaxID=2787631 RepID=UPI002EDB224E